MAKYEYASKPMEFVGVTFASERGQDTITLEPASGKSSTGGRLVAVKDCENRTIAHIAVSELPSLARMIAEVGELYGKS